MALYSELVSMGTLIAAGAVCGLIYDVIRAFNEPLSLRGICAFLRDLLFWAICTSFIYSGLFLTTQGKPRAALLIAGAVGAGFYFCILSPILLPPMARAASIICSAAAELGKYVVSVVTLPQKGFQLARKTFTGSIGVFSWLRSGSKVSE